MSEESKSNFITTIVEKESCYPQLFAEIKRQELPLVLYGAGMTASYLFDILLQYQVKISECIVDEQYYSDNKYFKTIPLNTLENILVKHPLINVFVAFVTRDIEAVINKLMETGKVNKVFCIDNPPIFSNSNQAFTYQQVLNNLKSYEKVYQLLEDEISRTVMSSYVNQRISGKLGYLDHVYTEDDYDPKGIFTFNNDEVFVDCGAFDGDTALKFVRNMQSLKLTYEKIIAIEPDYKNFEKLKQTGIDRLECVNKGVWRRKDKLSFSANGNMSSGISVAAGDSVPDIISVDSIDNIVGNNSITYLKMDVEGAEYQALLGANNTIKRCNPKLAVCLYHSVDDLIKIPLYIKSIEPRYKLFMRIHRPFSQELILYATTN